jgi:hypothetical protein
VTECGQDDRKKVTIARITQLLGECDQIIVRKWTEIRVVISTTMKLWRSTLLAILLNA